MQYRDGMGHVYDVPPERVAEFERRRTRLLVLAIIGKLIVIGLLIFVVNR